MVVSQQPVAEILVRDHSAPGHHFMNENGKKWEVHQDDKHPYHFEKYLSKRTLKYHMLLSTEMCI